MKTIKEFKLKDGDKEREFVLLRPTRRQREASEEAYAIEYGNSVRKGILTRGMVSKKYLDSGGTMSEEDAKALSGMYHKLKTLVDEQVRLNQKKTPTKKDKERLKALEEEMVSQRKEIAEVETQSNYLFTQTAETRAQQAAIRWFTLNLLREVVDGERVVFFDGETYDDKVDQYYEREEAEDNGLYLDIMDQAGTIMSLWYFSGGASSEEIDKMIKELS
jgi:hypothetical protein